MAQLLVRDIPQDVVDASDEPPSMAKSAEAEHRLIVEQVLRAGFRERAAALREQTRGRISIGSEELIRQDRDER